MTRRLLFLFCLAAAAVTACGDDEESLLVDTYQPVDCNVSAGTISGGPYRFIVDGIADSITGLMVTEQIAPDEAVILVADDTIRLVLDSLGAQDTIPFDAVAVDEYTLHYVALDGRVLRLEAGEPLEGVFGCFDVSEGIPITVTDCVAEPGTLAAGPLAIRVDATADFLAVDSVTATPGVGSDSRYVLADEAGVVAGFYDDLDDVATEDLNALSGDTLFLYLFTSDGDLVGDTTGTTFDDIQGCFVTSDPVSIARVCDAEGGQLEGGPYVVELDSEPDFVTDLALSGAAGDSSTYVITEEDGIILGLPRDLDALAAVDFNGAGEGVCLIWHLSYNGPIGGAVRGANATELTGCTDLSNPVEVRRNCLADGGRLQGGPFTFPIDDDADFASGLTLSGARGEGSTYVVTDQAGLILGLPGDLGAVGGIDFNNAGVDTCLIWHLSFSGEIEGDTTGGSADSLQGCFDLSNPVAVYRPCGAEAGTLTGGPYELTVDGEPDVLDSLSQSEDVDSLALSDNIRGSFTSYVITDTAGVILALPDDLESVNAFDFDGDDDAPGGDYLIWFFAAFGEFDGAEVGSNANEITSTTGCTDLSNPITVTRSPEEEE